MPLFENGPIDLLRIEVIRMYPARVIKKGLLNQLTSTRAAAACGMTANGLVGFVLWNSQIDEVKVGNIIQIRNGWCRLQNGEPVISSGRAGSLTILDNNLTGTLVGAEE